MQASRRYLTAAIFWSIPVLLAGVQLGDSWAIDIAERPHTAPAGANLVANPTIDGPGQWSFGGDGGHDPGISRSPDGSGSLYLQSTYDHGSDATVLESALIPVSAGQTYTFSIYMRSQGWPSSISLFVGNHDVDGTSIENSKGTRWGNSAAEIWEEAVIIYQPSRADIHYARLKIVRRGAPENSGRVWIDDVYFGEGIGLRQPPTPKRPFEGASVRIDALGNFEIARDGWKPFFPFCMYTDQDRPLGFYSEHGWNCNIWAANVDMVRRGAEAVSPFNPDGMMSGLGLTAYILERGWAFGQLDQLEMRLREIRDQGWLDHVLMYYWDNETYEAWDIPTRIVEDIIPRIDGSGTRSRQRPVYVLQGNPGLARVHASAGLSDLAGTYTGDGGRGGIAADPLFILDRTHNQSNAAGFAQFNGLRGAGDLRRRLYNAITLGAKAFGYWRDCYNSKCRERWGAELLPADEYPWWSDVPRLRQEVDALLPLIRAPHWTTWKIGVDGPDSVTWGTRDHDGAAWVILINNDEGSEATVTLDLGSAPYPVVGLRDYFDQRETIPAAADRVRVVLPALGVGRGTKVYELRRH